MIETGKTALKSVIADKDIRELYERLKRDAADWVGDRYIRLDLLEAAQAIEHLLRVEPHYALGHSLDLEDIRNMDGQPVWCVSNEDAHEEWGIVRVMYGEGVWDFRIEGTKRQFTSKDSRYGETWTAYPISVEYWGELLRIMSKNVDPYLQ